MPSFFTELLDQFSGPAFLEKVRVKFHYEETRIEELKEAAEEMLPLLSKGAFWERKPGGPCGLGPSQGEEAAAQYERVVVSLGPGLDALQDRYSEMGLLSKCYMVEVLAGELLMISYGAYNRYVEETTGWHVARYHFPGSEDIYPLEMMPDLLNGLTERVACNAAFCLIPKKSVVFMAELTKDEKVRCEGICMGCNNVYCANRTEDNFQTRRKMAQMADIPVSYGYSRIFGKL